ncbi:hypothetical protein ACFLX5_00075 [Chloroflexota bacterium]
MERKGMQQEVVSSMRKWQKIEDVSVSSTGQIIEKTGNPVVRLVMEIIQRDSQMHYLVQGFIADSIEHRAVSLTPDELIDVWEMIEKHIEIEKKSVEIAKQAIDVIGNQQGMVVQRYLIDYLLEDEEKHNALLKRLDDIKRGIYRSV